MKFQIKKGDQVRVIAGDDKGQEGKVLEILKEKHRALVEGVNMHTKHEKPSAQNPDGGITTVEGPIHVSNLMLLDGKGTASRIRIKRDNGKAERVSVKTGETIK